MLIQDAVTISQEVQSGTVFGSVRLYHVDDPTKPESSAQRMLVITYPAQALRQALSAVAQRLSGERTQGTSDGWGGPTSSSRTWAREKTRPRWCAFACSRRPGFRALVPHTAAARLRPVRRAGLLRARALRLEHIGRGPGGRRPLWPLADGVLDAKIGGTERVKRWSART